VERRRHPCSSCIASSRIFLHAAQRARGTRKNGASRSGRCLALFLAPFYHVP
jgi:hypothetical protein